MLSERPYLSLFKDSGKVKELFRCIKKCGVRDKGMRVFAQKNGTTYHSVKNYFYKNMLTPEIDDQLPRAAAKSGKKETGTASEKPVITVGQAILDAVKKKGDLPLEKEDIQSAADRAGVHYHTALSTWGNMIANAKAFLTTEPCGDRNCLWFKGDAYVALTENGLPYKEIAKIAKVSVSEVKKLVFTCKAFPRESRVYPLNFEYYHVVKNQDNPGEWLQKAVTKGLTTRELEALVKDKPIQTASAYRKENEDLRAENQELRAKLKGITEDSAVVTQGLIKIFDRSLNQPQVTQRMEKSANIVSLEHIRDMYNLIVKQSDRIAELESQLKAARKVSLSAMEMLVRKNVKVETFRNIISYLNSNGIKIVPAGILQQELQVQTN